MGPTAAAPRRMCYATRPRKEPLVTSPLLLAAVSNGVLIGLAIFAGIVLIIVLFMIGQFFSLWVQALVSGARVRLIDLIMMKFRKVDPRTIVFNRISAKKAGL